MFRHLRRHSVSPNDLLTSRLYNELTFYPTFLQDLKRCQNEVIIESPYMTTNRAALITPILKRLVKQGVRVTINTRYPGHHDQLLRIQAWTVTKELKQIGVKVRFFNDYNHRKIAILDYNIFYEGSLNILSQCRSKEIMRRVESEQLTRQMIQFLRLKRFYW
jgi:phosphatidylserine/phosphatidylglycerophosphate/cardiolipin synthase-like enzyme